MSTICYRIYDQTRKLAEGTKNPLGSAEDACLELGLRPDICTMIGWASTPVSHGRKACEAYQKLLDDIDDVLDPCWFWRALANLNLGLATKHPGDRREFFALAKRIANPSTLDGRGGGDAAYIQRRIRVVKFDDAPVINAPPFERRKLIDEMIVAGDFDTPGVVQRFLTENHPGDGYVEPGPLTINFVSSCLARDDDSDCYYSKVQMAALQEYLMKKFGL
ncbi:TPA: hypothetical protein DEP96_03710 [Candidatus Uhrbacteria bacterium]|nr:hypothetical protein [Candidatus Uhrbacteria bacterium]